MNNAEKINLAIGQNVACGAVTNNPGAVAIVRDDGKVEVFAESEEALELAKRQMDLATLELTERFIKDPDGTVADLLS